MIDAQFGPHYVRLQHRMSAHTLASILAFLGPLLAAIGAALLAYDAFQGPKRAHALQRFKSQTETVDAMYQYAAKKFTDPTPPYTPEEFEKVKSTLLKKRDAELSEFQDAVDAWEYRYRLRVAGLALLGFVLVAVGSLAQAVAALLS